MTPIAEPLENDNARHIAASPACVPEEPAGTPILLDHDGITELIPHRGRMSLLDGLLAWDEHQIHCVARNHRDPQHPLRSASGLLSSCLVEYAAQAMALHGGLSHRAALAAGQTPRIGAGYLASMRAVELSVWRLDDLPSGPPEATATPAMAPRSGFDDTLHIHATRRAGDAQQVLYDFAVHHAGHCLARGRAAVVLNNPLDPP